MRIIYGHSNGWNAIPRHGRCRLKSRGDCGGNVRLVERVVRVLEELAAHPEGIGVTKLANLLDEPPPTVHRILAVLAVHSLVRRESESRKYHLGPRVLALGDAYARSHPLISVAQPTIEMLRNQTSESAFVAELVDDAVVCVAVAESNRALRFFARVGQTMPLNAAASARAILAFLDPYEARVLLRAHPLIRFTDATIVAVDRLEAELAAVRTTGISVCEEEIEPGVTAVASPIFDARGRATASLAVVAPSHRLIGPAREKTVALLVDAARELSEALGFSSRAAEGDGISHEPLGGSPLAALPNRS
jgi:IclR family acetate operon transcriptional repressor